MKRRIFGILALVVLFAVPMQAQYARRIVPQAALPAVCTPGNGDVVFLTVAPIGMYQCTFLNTWSPVGLAGVAQQLIITQGTMTVSTPFVLHTGVWNAGGVTFTNLLSTVTDTASAAASLLFDFRVGANSMGALRKDGWLLLPAAGRVKFAAASGIYSSADQYMNLIDNAGTGFLQLTLGPAAVTHPGIQVSAAVGGNTQGIIITRGDGTTCTQAQLGAATNGSMIYCGDCTIANPCAGGGTGAIAKRLNGVWVCN